METINLKSLQECREACKEYDPKINYVEILKSIVYHQGVGNKEEILTNEQR